MIDWVSATLPLVHTPIETGRVISLDVDGSVEWESVKRTHLRGSFESTVMIGSVGSDGNGNATHLEIDGNPSKFLQGHNVFGSNNLLDLMLSLYIQISVRTGLPFTFDEMKMVKGGNFTLRRIDINEAFEVGNIESVRALLRSAELTSKTRHGRPTSKGSTVYYGKSSRRWSIKCYSKLDEINSSSKRSLPRDIDLVHGKNIKEWVQSKLRIELTLRGMELESLGLRDAKNWNIETVKNIYTRYTGRIQMNHNVTLPSQKAMELPRHLQSSYLLWKEGADLKSILPRRTFYRHCTDLKQFGIDISFHCQDVCKSENKLTLIEIITAKPAGLPDFAKDTGLIHDNTRMFSKNTVDNVVYDSRFGDENIEQIIEEYSDRVRRQIGFSA